MHILNSKKGTYFLADTLINRHPDTETLIDIAKLSDKTVRFFNHTPVISMLSYSNFGADTAGSPCESARSCCPHAGRISGTGY